MENRPFRQTPGSKAGYHPLRKLRNAWSGIVQAVVLDFSVQYRLMVSVAFLVLAAWYEAPFHFSVRDQLERLDIDRGFGRDLAGNARVRRV